MLIRNTARQFGRELYCHRNMAHAQVTHDMTMQQAIQQFNLNERRAIMQWLTQHGPFWEDKRYHAQDDYLECQSDVVTDTALGEAAWHCFSGNSYHLISLMLSDWMFTPISVIWRRNNDVAVPIDVSNHWEIDTIEAVLREVAPPLQSWEELASTMLSRCTNLVFASDTFEPLKGQPFVSGAAQRIVELLETLNRFKTCFDEQGQRTTEGNRLYQDHFTGDKAWFSDSSSSEKSDFKTELTFKHPASGTNTLFAWHGKVKTPQIRIHFSWPIQANESLYIVYVGPKLTKR
jgi:hypothetical protein